ncbi:MAG: hypothetical protein M1826_004024, partial [Phylliscum demangeonii]
LVIKHDDLGLTVFAVAKTPSGRQRAPRDPVSEGAYRPRRDRRQADADTSSTSGDNTGDEATNEETNGANRRTVASRAKAQGPSQSRHFTLTWLAFVSRDEHRMLEKWRAHPNLRLSRFTSQAVEPWAALFLAIRPTAPTHGAARNQILPLARAKEYTAFFVACAGVPGLNNLRCMLHTARAADQAFAGTILEWNAHRSTLPDKIRASEGARLLLSSRRTRIGYQTRESSVGRS